MTINKGDLLAGTGTLNQFSALPAGANGETIVYDSTQANGIKAASAGSTLLPYVDVAAQQLFDGSSVLSIDWNSRHLVDSTGSFGVVDWQFGQLDLPTAGNPPVVDWFSMQLNDQTITLSADWSQRYLYDSSGNLSIEWGNRFAFDSTGQYAIDWESRALFDNSSVETLGWGSRTLIDSTSQQSMNWNTRQLIDSLTTTSVDYENKQLIGAGTLAIDWTIRSLSNTAAVETLNWDSETISHNGATVIDWRNHLLIDNSSVNSLNWDSRSLFNTSGSTTVAWQAQQLNDSGGTLSEDWNLRRLYASDGVTIVIDWSVANGVKVNGSTLNVNKSRAFSAQTLAVNTGRQPSTTNDTFINFSGSITNIAALNSNISLQSSPDNAAWTTLQTFQMPLLATAQQSPFSALIPAGYYYKWIATTSAGGTTAISTIQELSL